MTQSLVNSDKVKLPDGWKACQWPYNSAITLPCYEGATKRYRKVYVHPAFKCINPNVDLGEWEIENGFEFTVKGQFSGRCPAIINTIEQAIDYVLNYDK